MTIVVGTKSKRKQESLEKILKELNQKSAKVVTYNANSKVAETPWNTQTYKGAKNRALDCRKNITKANYWIGVESGLVKRSGHIYEEAWCVTLDSTGKEFSGYSSGLKLPDYILDQMKKHNLPHYKIFSKINKHKEKHLNSDTWGQYTGNMLLRKVSIEEALRNTLIPVFAPKESFYSK